MKTVRLIQNLARNDLRLIFRDHFLVSMFLFVVFIAVTLRFGLPWLDVYLAGRGVLPNSTVAQRLADFYPLLIAFFVVFQGPLIAGAIFGFSLLDEKDDHTIKAMLVTPVRFSVYVAYRISVPTLISFVIVVGEVLFINLSHVPLWQLVLIALGASLTGPIAALFYAVTAENKVQGFAIAKFVGLAGWVILLGWFVSEPWQWLFGAFPPFFVSQAYWFAQSNNESWLLALALGIALQAGLLVLLIKRFTTVAYR